MLFDRASSGSARLRRDDPRAADYLPRAVERLDLNELRGTAERDRGLSDPEREAALPPRDIPPVGSRREAVLLPPRDIPLAGSRREPLNRSGEAFVPPIARQPSVMEADRDEGWLAGPRRFTNRAFDALDEIGSWVFGR
jgi:hypothetical protein